MNKRHPVRGRRKHIARWVTIIKYGLLTLDKFLRGLTKAIEDGAPITINAEDGSVDMSDMDADCADTIVQYALFGEVVFG